MAFPRNVYHVSQMCLNFFFNDIKCDQMTDTSVWSIVWMKFVGDGGVVRINV